MFPECRTIAGVWRGCCGNCKWRDWAMRCSVRGDLDLASLADPSYDEEDDEDSDEDEDDGHDEDEKPDVKRLTYEVEDDEPVDEKTAVVVWAGASADNAIVLD